MREQPRVRNDGLADAIRRSGLRKDHIAATTGVHPSRLSRFIAGTERPSNKWLAQAALLLRVDETDIRPAPEQPERKVAA